MGTSWEQIETQAMTYIKNDLLLNEDMERRLPVFYWKMSAYMRLAIPRFNRPPEIIQKLAHTSQPRFDSIIYTADEDLEAEAEIHTEQEGYDICSAGLIQEDNVGIPQYVPLNIVSYDSETGIVKLQEAIDDGTEITFDFYKSAEFESNLTFSEADLLAFCIYVAWEHRFSNNAIERTSKIRDSSFMPVSEASMTNANTSRLREINSELFDRLRAYEQGVEYMGVVKHHNDAY